MESKSKKLTVTIGISAHNEEQNIGRLIETLLMQTEENYILNSIFILCDGCTDNTVSIAEAYSQGNNRVVVHNDGKQIGKIERVNWLCKNIKTDILVIFDADITINDSNVVAKLVSGFDNSHVGLVAGLQLPRSPKTYLEKIFSVWEEVWIETRIGINNGVSVHNISGCNFAMRKCFFENVYIPKEAIAEDEFLFFAVKKSGYDFVFVPDAVVRYQLPSNFTEYVLQSTRFITTKYKVIHHFDDVNISEYRVSFLPKIKALCKVFIHKPIVTIFSVLLQCYVRIYMRIKPLSYRDGLYTQAASTK